MFQVVERKDEDYYMVLDTDDGCIEPVSVDDLLYSGLDISGVVAYADHAIILGVRYNRVMRGNKFPLYPNKAQREMIAKTFGCCRKVWNLILGYKIEYYEMYGENIQVTPAKFKNDYPYLKDVDSTALGQSERKLNTAFNNFFGRKEVGYPKFKSKHNPVQSYNTYVKNGKNPFDADFRHVYLPKIGSVKVKFTRDIHTLPKTLTVSKDAVGNYWLSFYSWEYVEQFSGGDEVGIDLGIKSEAVLSTGVSFENPKALYRHQRKLAILQQKLSKYVEGSCNYKKTKHQIAKLHARIRNIRVNNLHNISSRIVKENQLIVCEKLNVKGMMKNHNLAGSIADASWYELTRQLAYKSDWHGRLFHQIDTYYPSTQKCSCCGYVNTNLRGSHGLSIREWTCPSCNTYHDRDINAAKNILARGKFELRSA